MYRYIPCKYFARLRDFSMKISITAVHCIENARVISDGIYQNP